MDQNFSITTSISPSHDAIAALYHQIGNSIRDMSNDRDFASALSRGAAELLDNAVRHGYHEDHKKNSVHLSLKTNEKHATIEVRNKIRPEDEANLDKLDDIIQKIRGYSSPLEAFRESVKEAKNSNTGDTCLGLVRLAYETGADLDFYMSADDEIAVSAVIQLTNTGKGK